MSAMYGPIDAHWGVSSVKEQIKNLDVTQSPDGLTVVVGGRDDMHIVLPAPLEGLLLDLRLLRGVPLAYLVPDPALLPPESIRFFNVDRTWVDRLIDGVWSIGNSDTLGLLNKTSLLPFVRAHLDRLLGKIATAQEDALGAKGTVADWDAATGDITGLLIRSELARRWPDMIVTGSDGGKKVALLRSEPMARDLYIALFAGRPNLVEIREPHVGTRFGVEAAAAPEGGYKVDQRKSDGSPQVGGGPKDEPKDQPIPIAVHLRFPKRTRVLDVKKLAKAIAKAGKDLHGTFAPSRMVALHLEQRPYVQEFQEKRGLMQGVDESRGSVPLNDEVAVPMRKGRPVLDLTELRERQRQLDDLGEDPK